MAASRSSEDQRRKLCNGEAQQAGSLRECGEGQATAPRLLIITHTIIHVTRTAAGSPRCPRASAADCGCTPRAPTRARATASRTATQSAAATSASLLLAAARLALGCPIRGSVGDPARRRPLCPRPRTCPRLVAERVEVELRPPSRNNEEVPAPQRSAASTRGDTRRNGPKTVDPPLSPNTRCSNITHITRAVDRRRRRAASLLFRSRRPPRPPLLRRPSASRRARDDRSARLSPPMSSSAPPALPTTASGPRHRRLRRRWTSARRGASPGCHSSEIHTRFAADSRPSLLLRECRPSRALIDDLRIGRRSCAVRRSGFPAGAVSEREGSAAAPIALLPAKSNATVRRGASTRRCT